MKLDEYFQVNGWQIVDVQKIPQREGIYYEHDDVNLTNQSSAFLKREFPNGIYHHQKEAIKSFLEGQNVCLTTGTASGKSLAFYIAAMEILIRYPNSKIIAIYPLRALGKEQEERWARALNNAGFDARVGRIDGQIPMNIRPDILRDSQVLILTPDIIHAWLLNSLSNRAIVNFLKQIALVIVDEVHNYTGVFGSNSAYLFRRMQHIMNLLGSSPRYFAASATIPNPELHLKRLLESDFKVIGMDSDTSPRQDITIKLVDPIDAKDSLTNLSGFIEFVAKNTNHKFVAFVDSRKQTEYITSIISRSLIQEDEDSFDYDHLQLLDILPYRAGYEVDDRNAIQDRLSSGKLMGVVSTSALELGIDIPFLTLGILVGVPRSATSLYQRIGRIGRHSNGEVIVINTGDIHSENIFRDTSQLLNMPLSEVALYLQNQRIQYIHALCLARHGGEHDQVCSSINMEETSFMSSINWPEGFLKLCESERIGIVSTEFQNLKAQAGDDPNHIYPLRDVDMQFQVEHRRGGYRETCGSLSHSQLMREAYPGAVYYYITRPFRVYRVNLRSRIIEVRSEKRYTTKPQAIPIMVFPNLTQENMYIIQKYGDLTIIECNLQIRETIIGFKERRGPSESNINYPIPPSLGLYFDRPRFTRNYFTTGIIITHPILNKPGVSPDVIANLLFEAFLMIVPFERRDINFASDKHRMKNWSINEGDRFVCIYDQTYGSLRLSGRIMEEKILIQILEKCVHLSQQNEILEINFETAKAIGQIFDSLSETPISPTSEPETHPQFDTNRFEKVIMPGSKGLNIQKDNEEFSVEGVFFSPHFNGLAYRGKHVLNTSHKFEDSIITIPINTLKDIPGESKFGLYDYETGDLKEL